MGDMLPGMRRVALLLDTSGPQTAFNERYARLASKAAAAKGLSLDAHRVQNPDDIRRALRLLETRRADVLLIAPSPPFHAMRREICQSAEKIRLAVMGFTDDWAQDGALVSFGPSLVDAMRRSASFVDRIFKRAKPADLPIEQPMRFPLVVNARTAKALGIEIPGLILIRAERVIE
jgi:putative tryptophan/tyrosine transport system substrate-binding protein